MNKQQNFDLTPKRQGPVECLGMTFESDDARRAYFQKRLKEKLKDPEFRKIPGFPEGTDDDILRMSDPPYFAACPNPFLAEFVQVYGRPYDSSEEYHREPFAVDVSVGKTEALYKAHAYHTKVPPHAIVPSILHYTQPGDLILDAFCGSGMTGVATHLANSAPGDGENGKAQRRAVLADLSPYASYIAAAHNIPFDTDAFAAELDALWDDFEEQYGWMYRTIHPQDGGGGRVNYVVWTEEFACPSCQELILFLREARAADGSIQKEFPCPNCRALCTKDTLTRVLRTKLDEVTGESIKQIAFAPVAVNYTYRGVTYEKAVDEHDLQLLERIESEPLRYGIPVARFPIANMYHGSRLAPKGITYVHHMYLKRPLLALSYLWSRAAGVHSGPVRNGLLFLVEQALVTMTLQNRYQEAGFKQVNKYLPGVYYIPSVHCEVSPLYAIQARGKRLQSTFRTLPNAAGNAVVSTGSAEVTNLPDASIDYVFTDPPFGENIFYADLNFIVEAWHGVYTRAEAEAIVDKFKQKNLTTYQNLMAASFAEYFRVLKPGRWITVVFSNSANAVWRAIQEGVGRAGFVVADVRTLDKQLGSYRQVTSSAMKQDLVISAYKPREALTNRFRLEAGTAESAWTFVNEHLANVPLFVAHSGESEVIAERTPQMLLDRMVAFHVQRGVAVPFDAADFFLGLEQRYAKRDGMYFLQDQVVDYDKKRAKVESVKQLSFDVTDEASAILWLRMELDRKPQSFQDLQPVFMRESQTWVGHERTVELKEILEENLLMYDGVGPVPAQIHTYLSTNFKDMRGLSKDDPALKAKAEDRWYVPDLNKQSDLDQIRRKRLLKEFLEYKDVKQKKLKQFRTEAIRAGFKAAYDQKDYRTIVEVAKKLPEQVIQEDEKLLMYYDVASIRLGED